MQITVGVLKAATKYAAANGLLVRDPLAGFKRPRAESKTMDYWTAEQARQFLAYTRDDRMAAVWALFLTRGPRRGEIAGLRWSDVDLDAGEIRISTTRVLVDNRAVVSEPKTKRGHRIIPLDDLLVALLDKHHVQQKRLAAGPAYAEGDYLVADELGKP